MKFVPVPNTQVLFSIWDTREQDYDAYLRDEHPDWEIPKNSKSAKYPVVKVELAGRDRLLRMADGEGAQGREIG